MSGSVPKKLDAVRVFDNDSNLVKQYDFTYSYFNNSYSGSYPHVFKRLKLTQLSDPSDDDFSYTFNYIDGSLPAKNSKNTDYWGYYNGIEQGQNYYCPLRYGAAIYSGADKTANFLYMKIGTLESFTNPTKGTTTFEYDAEHYTIHGTTSTSTVTHHIVRTYNVYNEDLYDTYSQYPEQITDTISLQTLTSIRISGFADSDISEHGQDIIYDHDYYPALRISRIKSNGTTEQVYTVNVPAALQHNSSCDFPDDTLMLASGTYLVEAIAQLKDTWFAITCEYDGTETITTTTPDQEIYGGGMRIRKITGATTKEYTYEDGKLLVNPVYGKREKITLYEMVPNNNGSGGYDIDYAITTYVVQKSESTVPMSSLNDGNVFGYSKVTEKVGGVSTVHTYSNDAGTTSGAMTLSYIPTDYYPTNGLLKKTEQGGRTVDYYYDIVEADNEVRGFIYDSGFDEINEYSYEIRWPLLSQVRTITREQNDSITVTNYYTYDDNFQRLTESINNADGTYTKQYAYPSATSSNTVLATMAQRYMIGVPYETLLLHDSSIIDGRRTEYMEVSGMLVPHYEKEMENKGLVSLNTYADSLKTQLTYASYNAYGKPMQVTFQGINTVYLWGYNGTVPIAEIRNATYDQVTSRINANTLAAIASRNVPTGSDWNAINNLRTTLPAAQVTTYAYQPLVGVSAITDPRGFTTYYDYDSSGRLSESYIIKNNQRSVLQHFDYHYKP